MNLDKTFFPFSEIWVQDEVTGRRKSTVAIRTCKDAEQTDQCMRLEIDVLKYFVEDKCPSP